MGEPEARCLRPVFLDMYCYGTWESRRNDASGRGFSTYQAKDRGRARTDASGQVISAYQAVDRRRDRTDATGQVCSTYRAMHYGWVGVLLPLAGFIQIEPWNAGGSELQDARGPVETMPSPTLQCHPPPHPPPHLPLRPRHHWQISPCGIPLA